MTVSFQHQAYVNEEALNPILALQTLIVIVSDVNCCVVLHPLRDASLCQCRWLAPLQPQSHVRPHRPPPLTPALASA